MMGLVKNTIAGIEHHVFLMLMIIHLLLLLLLLLLELELLVEFPTELLSVSCLVVLKPIEHILSLDFPEPPQLRRYFLYLMCCRRPRPVPVQFFQCH